ncbi:hypothetical protein HDU93_005848 [Gonapodya sp. JEL0774]|nr:hypothetical protein HDU93_005848 [Gonapodya sp. JEL0774]
MYWGENTVSIDRIANSLAMLADDVVLTLRFLEVVRVVKGSFVIVVTDRMSQIAEKMKLKGCGVDEDMLHWVPPEFRRGTLAGRALGLETTARGKKNEQKGTGNGETMEEWVKPVVRKGYRMEEDGSVVLGESQKEGGY